MTPKTPKTAKTAKFAKTAKSLAASPRARARRYLTAIVAVAIPLLASPHELGLSTGELEAQGRDAELRVQWATRDLAVFAPGDPLDLDAAARKALASVELRQDGTPCDRNAGGVTPAPPDGVSAVARFTCPRPLERVEVRLAFLEQMPSGHVHLLRAGGGEQLLQRGADRALVTIGAAGVPATFLRFLLLGVEHIFFGLDHLAFLVGLLLLGGSGWSLVRVVTAFTVAHSLTLAAAVLFGLTLAPSVVEPLIAASVLFVALENLWATRGGPAAAATLRRRWLVTFAFGLVHGLGFAGILLELRLPRPDLVGALVAFNLGVEAGQLTVVGAVVLFLRYAPGRRTVPLAWARWGSVALALAGASWLVARVAGQ